METIAMNQILSVDKDAFSSGQIGSKLWMCEELEKLFEQIDTLCIYGGWYGITALLLKSRNKIKIGTIRSFDVDPACEIVADAINEHWIWQDWEFKAQTKDCNLITPINVDMIINTSTEHFESMTWWNNIPQGTVVVLQGNNMPHDDHHIHSDNLDEFISKYPVSNILYNGQKEFVYPTWNFTRFMLIGVK